MRDGARRSAPRGWEDARRVLVIRLDNVGDVVMTGPALRALRRALPAASIALMSSPAGSRVAPLLPWIDDVLVHRASWQDTGGSLPFAPARERALADALRARRFDAAVILTSFSQSPYPPAYACYLAGIPLRAGQSREFGGQILSHWVKALPDATHQVDRNLHLVAALGFPLAGTELELAVPRADDAASARLLASAGVDPDRRFLLVAPGASCDSRRYEPARFALLARLLAAETDLPVVVAGSERERALAEPIVAGAAGLPVVSLVGRTSVPEFAALVRRAAAVVANNSSALHLADAFRRPLTVLFAGTDFEEQWRPRSSPARLVRRPTPCSPCYRFSCPYDKACLDVPPEEVAEHVLDLLAVEAEEDIRPHRRPPSGVTTARLVAKEVA